MFDEVRSRIAAMFIGGDNRKESEMNLLESANIAQLVDPIAARNVTLNLAIAAYKNAGGSYGIALSMLDAAYGQRKRGGSFAAEGPRKNDGEEGQRVPADYASQDVPSSLSTNHAGSGHSNCAAKQGRSVSAVPVREPSKAQRKAAKAVRGEVALTILDTHKIRDGRAIGDVLFGEIETLRIANAMEASIFRQIQRRYAFAAPDTKLRDIVKPEDLNAIKQKAAEVADAQ